MTSKRYEVGCQLVLITIVGSLMAYGLSVGTDIGDLE